MLARAVKVAVIYRLHGDLAEYIRSLVLDYIYY